MNKIPYTVVHSNNPWLLVILETELYMTTNLRDEEKWNEVFNPFPLGKCNEALYLTICGEDIKLPVIEYHNHSGFDGAVRYELTSRNYTKVLTKILGQ